MEGEFICSPSPDLSVLMMFSLLTRYWGRLWWLWGLLPLLVDVMLYKSLYLSARGQFVCWHRRVFCVCFHACLLYAPALLLRECGEPVGSVGANEMYHWPHNPAALNTLLCVYTRRLTSNTHWTRHSLKPVCGTWRRTHTAVSAKHTAAKFCMALYVRRHTEALIRLFLTGN